MARAVTAVLVSVRMTVALHVVRAVLLVPMRPLLTAATSLQPPLVPMTNPPLSASARLARPLQQRTVPRLSNQPS